MKRYARVTDEEKGLCNVGLGDPDAIWIPGDILTPSKKISDLYVSLGMSIMDVEKGFDGNWYLSEKVPLPPPEPETKTVRTFAKDAIWVATKDMILDAATGLTAWEAFKTFLLDSGLWEGWSMQAYLLEENPFFAEFYPKAVAVFGSELVDKVLAASVVESREVVVG
jgi:hypothetical protein